LVFLRLLESQGLVSPVNFKGGEKKKLSWRKKNGGGATTKGKKKLGNKAGNGF